MLNFNKYNDIRWNLCNFIIKYKSKTEEETYISIVIKNVILIQYVILN